MPNPTRRPSRPVVLERDHARPRSLPAPTTDQFDAQLTLLVYPVALGLRDRFRGQGYRERILTLPVMVGILLSLVWRQIPSVAEVKRVLGRESLLWVAPTTVSQQAISDRLETMPAELFGAVWQELAPVLQQRAAGRPHFHAEVLQTLAPCYARVWVLDSSRLEAVFKKTGAVRGTAHKVLGGTLTAVLDLGSHLPVQVWVDPSPTVNDRTYVDLLLPHIPADTILVLDRGFNGYASCDAVTDHGGVVVGRWTANWAADLIQTLPTPTGIVDQLVQVGKYRSNPCRHRLRRIGQQRGGQWQWWVTTELNPQRLSAEQVIALYAQRWRIEEAFLQIKRLLNLSYLWGSSANAVALQVWTTVLLYGVLIDLCGELGMALGVPAERISVEMTYRSLYHYARACQQGETRELVGWLSDPKQADLGLVKRQRKRSNPDSVARTTDLNL
ncbi:MAG TPA: IS4 family transposase [Actinomycetota bacterium]|nr:IS4 family transposase [Actinomycetota bacterium]